MPLQKQVDIELAVGVPGMKATPDQAIYTPINYVAGEGGVSAGTFCWADSTKPGVAKATPAATEAPLGFVERVISTYGDATLVLPEGEGLTVAVRGDYYVQTSEKATVGGAVYVDKTNGKILAAAGSSGIDTGWQFRTAGEENALVIISNWNTGASTVAAAEISVDLSKATGTLDIAHGGTGKGTAAEAWTALGGKNIGKKDKVSLASEVTDTLAVEHGGTGATTKEQACTNLGAQTSDGA